MSSTSLVTERGYRSTFLDGKESTAGPGVLLVVTGNSAPGKHSYRVKLTPLHDSKRRAS